MTVISVVNSRTNNHMCSPILVRVIDFSSSYLLAEIDSTTEIFMFGHSGCEFGVFKVNVHCLHCSGNSM